MLEAALRASRHRLEGERRLSCLLPIEEPLGGERPGPGNQAEGKKVSLLCHERRPRPGKDGRGSAGGRDAGQRPS